MSRASRAEWSKRVERWRDSGLTAKEYAAETGLKASTLSYWGWKLKTSGASPRAQRRRGPGDRSMASVPVAGFVEIGGAKPASAPATMELELGGGVLVRVASGFDEGTLTRIVRAVEAAR